MKMEENTFPGFESVTIKMEDATPNFETVAIKMEEGTDIPETQQKIFNMDSQNEEVQLKESCIQIKVEQVTDSDEDDSEQHIDYSKVDNTTTDTAEPCNWSADENNDDDEDDDFLPDNVTHSMHSPRSKKLFWQILRASMDQAQKWYKEQRVREKARRPKLSVECDSCHRYFINEAELTDHFKQRHDQAIGDHVCKICRYRFNSEVIYRQHIAPHTRYYKCNLCNYETRGIRVIEAHAEANHGFIKVFKPPAIVIPGESYWDVRWVSKEQALIWYNDDISGEIKKHYVCDVCQISFAQEDELKEHEKTKHHVDAGTLQCNICKYRFKKLSILNAHLEAHYLNHRCKRCEFTTRWLKDMESHAVEEHGYVKIKIEEKKSGHHLLDRMQDVVYRCDYCEETRPDRDLLCRHMEIEHKDNIEAEAAMGKPPDEYKVFCEACRAYFLTAKGYRQHITLNPTHSNNNELKYKCKECGARFLTKKLRQSHMERIHTKADADYKCKICSKSFANARTYKTHVANKHEKLDSSTKLNVCQECHKRFSSQKILDAHMSIHNQDKQYRCVICPSTFAYTSSLYAHYKKVHRTSRKIAENKMAKHKMAEEDVS